MDQFSIIPGPLERSYQETHAELRRLQFTSQLWQRRVEMWTDDGVTRGKIGNRLGWLDALAFVTPHLDRLRACAAAVRADGYTDVLLLGMGGSSLAPEVIRQVIGVHPDMPRFRMLDSVDPDAVDSALSKVEKTLFVFASKSGGTIEPNAMAAEAARRLESAGVHPWGSRFIAVTDEGTALHRRAVSEQFRDIFVNPADIGGRYSALSFFGLLPAALMGVDLEGFVAEAHAMAGACRSEDEDNPGTALGAFMASAALNGRDKLTLLLPDRLASLGLWVEQLVAESTGKDGVGVVPVAGERADAHMGDDRAVVIAHLGAESPDPQLVDAVRRRGLPCAELRIPGPASLGAEFFRWEIATAAAGRLLGVNPFDEPNVQQAKDATKALLDSFEATGALPSPKVDLELAEARFTLSEAARALATDPRRFLDCAGPGDYVSTMAFLPPDDERMASALEGLRRHISATSRCATMLGYGPRYLHSTGQLHKGGANNGVFILITAPPLRDFPVPDAPYSFATLEQAQAIGDFQSLERTGRRALLVQLPSRTPESLSSLGRILARA